MERFSYKGGCGVRERILIEAFKIDKRLQLIINTVLFQTVILLRI